ncbi:MAG: hypothetical protein R2818_02675 [Flavobacteriales bacterium]
MRTSSFDRIAPGTYVFEYDACGSPMQATSATGFAHTAMYACTRRSSTAHSEGMRVKVGSRTVGQRL